MMGTAKKIRAGHVVRFVDLDFKVPVALNVINFCIGVATNVSSLAILLAS